MMAAGLQLFCVSKCNMPCMLIKACCAQVTNVMCVVSAKAYASRGQPDQVKRILAEMRHNSLEITPNIWGTLVSALVNAGQLEG